MKFFNFLAFCFVLAFSGCSFAEKVKRMECEWDAPKRFLMTRENLWTSEPEEDELSSYFHFENDFFDENHIAISDEQTNLVRKIYYSVKDNSFEIIIYRDYLKSNEKVSFPSYIVIKNQKGKGVFYLDGLRHDEIINMTRNCMPYLEQKITGKIDGMIEEAEKNVAE